MRLKLQAFSRDLLPIRGNCSASTIMKSSMLASVIASAGAAGTLKLTYQDCGAAHGKVTGLSPNTLTRGQKTTVTGSGSVDEAQQYL